MNRRINELYKTDQEERRQLPPFNDPKHKALVKKVFGKDKKRQKRLISILKGKKNLTAEDYYKSAMIFQHSGRSLQKHAIILAKKSMDMGYERAKWLYAAAVDRSLMYQGRKQKFGTQMEFDQGKNRLILHPIDKRTSPQSRARYNVPNPQKTLKEFNLRYIK